MGMRVKKNSLYPEVLARYGFRRNVIDLCRDICEYEKDCGWHKVLIQRCSGDVAIVIPGSADTDTVNLDNTIYQMIQDGIIELCK